MNDLVKTVVQTGPEIIRYSEPDGTLVVHVRPYDDGRAFLNDGLQGLIVPAGDIPEIVGLVRAVPDRGQIPGGVFRKLGLCERYD